MTVDRDLTPRGNGRPLGPRKSACPGFTAWRLRARLSCEDVAELLSTRGQEISERAVGGWEAGTYRPNEDRIEALADIAGKSTELVAAWFQLELTRSA